MFKSRNLFVIALVAILAMTSLAYAQDRFQNSVVLNAGKEFIVENGATSPITSWSGNLILKPKTSKLVVQAMGNTDPSLDLVGKLATATLAYDDATNTISTTSTLSLSALTAVSFEVTTGDLTVTAGDLYVTVGDLEATAGSLSAGTTVTAGTGLVATTGGVTATAGDIVATAGDITATAGDITATAGDIVATAGAITATAGNIEATAGSVSAGTTVTAGTGLVATTGGVTMGTTHIYVGAQTTRDTVRGEVGTTGAIGSLYCSTAGKLYLKVANADATTDWQLVTATAAD